MWYQNTVFYQIYPLGLCDAPPSNDGVEQSRLLTLLDWVSHIKRLGAGAVYLCPVFESDAHGYDTRDFLKIDVRLGSNQDFKKVVQAFHQAGIKVVLDGVFHHVGRGFFAFLNVLKERERSPFRDWFHLDFNRNSPYQDGLWYEGWEGHFELVKLNLENSAVREYLLDCVTHWMDWWEIDGIRLDVAYLLNEVFMRQLRQLCCDKQPDFFLVGEMIHGDYNRIMGPDLLHSVTNYECYKGLYSAFNSKNMFEIGHSLNRQFGSEPWCLYRDKQLFSFLDNHDVTRIASILQNIHHLPLVFGLLLGMPGIPCLYYGSEWGIAGEKSLGDQSLRPALAHPKWNELTDQIQKWIVARTNSPALCLGSFQIIAITNEQIIFERSLLHERVLVACNCSDRSYVAHGDVRASTGMDLESGTIFDFSNGILMPPYSVSYYQV